MSEKSLKEIGAEVLASKVNLEVVLPILGDKLEREALSCYKENEEWALRAILQDSKPKDADGAWEQIKLKFRQELAEELSPEQLEQFPIEELLDGLPSLIEDYVLAQVKGWQRREFDPLSTHLRKLKLKGCSKNYLSDSRIIVSHFIARFGRKEKYEVNEVEEFLETEKNKLSSDGSYATRYSQLMSFLRSLPEGEELVKKIPKPKKSKVSPTVRVLSREEIENLIVSAFVDREPMDILARLVLCTVYGCRVGEVAQFSKDNVDLENKVIRIETEKGGEIKPQRIPDGLELFFADGLNPIPRYKLWPLLRRLLRNAQIDLAEGLPRTQLEKRRKTSFGTYHALRRGVVTALNDVEVDGLSIYDWMRWSKGRQFGMLPTYVKTKPEESNRRVLEKHPFVPMWQAIVPIIEGGCLYYNNNEISCEAP